MTRFVSAVFVAVLASALGGPARADEKEYKDAKASLDKAIKALGGEEKLGKVKAITFKSKGKLTIGGGEGTFTSETTVQGLDQMRGEFTGEFGGMEVKGVNVLNGDK